MSVEKLSQCRHNRLWFHCCTASHLPERAAVRLTSQIPKGGIDRRDGKRGNAAAADVMDVPLHGVIERLDIFRVMSHEKRFQVVPDHRQYRGAAAPACVRIAGAVPAVGQSDRGGNEFEMRMVAVFGVGEDFFKRNAKEPCVDLVNFCQGRYAMAITLWMATRVAAGRR